MLNRILLFFVWVINGAMMIFIAGSILSSLIAEKSTGGRNNEIEIKTTGESYSAHYEVNVLHPQISIPYKRLFNIPSKKTKEALRTLGEKTLTLHLVVNGSIAEQSIIGDYSMVQNRLVLVPRNTLGRNMQFAVRKKKRVLGVQTVLFETPQFIPTDEPLAKIIRWYPSGEYVPENTLVFYAMVDRPVLIDANSIQAMSIQDGGSDIPQALSAAFLPKSPSLQTMIPFLIHPGRIKHGVRLREILGPVMTKGKEYTLHIENTVGIDSYYRPLASSSQKTYTAGNFDTKLPIFYPRKSKIPHKDSFEPLQLVFSEAMDYASIVNYIVVYPSDKEHIVSASNTTTELEFQEIRSMQGEGIIPDSMWLFIPQKKWEKGKYTVHIAEYVKDLAHNSLDVPFEVSDPQTLGEGKSRYFEFNI